MESMWSAGVEPRSIVWTSAERMVSTASLKWSCNVLRDHGND